MWMARIKWKTVVKKELMHDGIERGKKKEWKKIRKKERKKVANVVTRNAFVLFH